MAKLTHSEYSIQVLEAAFAKGREVRHNVLVSYLPNFQVLSKIDDGYSGWNATETNAISS